MVHYHIVNESIGLGIFSSRITIPHYVKILESEDSMRPFYLRASRTYDGWLVCGVGWSLATIGSFFRYILYSHMYDRYKTRQSTPIDKLIFVSASIQHITNLGRMIFFTIMISKGVESGPWESEMNDIGQVLCYLTKFSITFELHYSCVGSLGISLFRILFIKHDDLVKNKIGERNLLFLILLGGVLLSFLMTMITFDNDYESLLMKNGQIPANQDILLALHEYKTAGGHSSPYFRYIYPRVINGMVMVGMTIAEMCIYIAFFHFVYRHDNSEWLAKILAKKSIQHRNKTNAITFFGQFCSFIFELSYWILFLLANLVGGKGFLWTSASFLRFISFGVMAAMDVLISNTLRTRFLRSLHNVWKAISKED